jgi:uncharacterized membrane protein YgdD (TMEM256/DUF423 family)
MNLFQKRMILIAVFFISTAIIFGAFAAHALKAVLSEDQLISIETGVKYQMYGGLGLLLITLLLDRFSIQNKSAQMLIALGTALFSFSIYFLNLQSLIGLNIGFILGPTTPIGGTLLIVGWCIVFVKILKSKL